MEIKVGDKVRVSKDAQEIFVYSLNPLWFTEESTVIGTHPDGVVIKLDANNHLTTGLAIPTKYLTKVNAEADANEELQEEYARFMSGRTPFSFADRIEHELIQRRMRVLSQDDILKDFNPAEHEVNLKPLNTEFWVKYEADLAKEIAVKVANKYNAPKEAADYAVLVAKAVVENLKKK